MMDATVEQYKDITDNKNVDKDIGEKEKEIKEAEPDLEKDRLLYNKNGALSAKLLSSMSSGDPLCCILLPQLCHSGGQLVLG